VATPSTPAEPPADQATRTQAPPVTPAPTSGSGAGAGAAARPRSDSDLSLPASPFAASDPHSRARRLARALVSDMVVYNADRRQRSLQNGTIRQEFRDEIKKSWEEYVAQVGNQFARETSYFRDALNDILAGGVRLF
jgi:hypothetical protein